jgi:hypothetical protein
MNGTTILYRSYDSKNWEFDDLGYIAATVASINDLPIREERKYHWPLRRRLMRLSELAFERTEIRALSTLNATLTHARWRLPARTAARERARQSARCARRPNSARRSTSEWPVSCA